MAPQQGRGVRASTWFKVQRCLVVLYRLQQGPATRDELIHAVEVALGSAAYGLAAEKALDRDIQQLRRTFDLQISLRQGVYFLAEVGSLPLLNLPDEALRAMAFLYRTFQPGTPGTVDVRDLLDTLLSYLPEERRQMVHRMRVVPRLDLHPVDEGGIDEQTWDTVERAVVKRHRLAFDYISPRHEKREPRHHIVEPYDLDFDDGHYYLDAFCLHWTGPFGSRNHHDYIRYRVGYIVPGSARMLPNKLAPGRRKPRTYTLRYELAPVIARGGVSRRFPEMEVHIREDGWAEVTAKITSPFMAAKRLLYYGAGCRVLDPPEVVRLVKEAVRGMAEMYGFIGE
jgi:predicted DNA-binding transcriptional regulator YafY